MERFKLLTEIRQDVPALFNEIAALLLNQAELVVAGEAHRLVEIEFYLHGGDHEDPFAHCDPLQKTTARWYFHREGGAEPPRSPNSQSSPRPRSSAAGQPNSSRGAYRGGSFKGLDISFAPGEYFGGVLIRTLAKPDGALVNGCSLCVDHLLAVTGHAKIADLDAAIADRPVWDPSSPLHLRLNADLAPKAILPTARVGLTLKRMYTHKTMPAYIMRDYRFLTDPTIKKGKLHSVIALHKQGRAPDEIKALTRSPAKSIEGYAAAFEAGRGLESFDGFRGRALKTGDLCQLHGLWHATYGG